MKVRYLKFWSGLGNYLFFLVICLPTPAQIVPDTTLPVNSTVTPKSNTPLGSPSAAGGQGATVIHQIDGGTKAGGNLFHSFQEFSLPTGETVIFNNSHDVQNIINRVTGNSASNIDGSIKANGTANLFLLNPNGIIFGPHAQLNIGGSFVASTAGAIAFADRTQFSAKPNGSTPLLTVSVPIGLQFGSFAPSPILVQGSNLQVQPGRTLALVGGDITLNGGKLTAETGRIELTSIADGSWVISQGAQPATKFGDIQLSQQALVDASGSGGGNILVQARRLRLTDGSQIRANTNGTEPGGNLTVNASESVEAIGRLPDGTPSALQARVEAGATGTGGNIYINTGRLRLEGGARVAASSLEAQGNAGNITIQATDAVEVVGAGNVLQEGQNFVVQPSALTTQTTGAGNAGNVIIETGKLIASEGGQISSETFATGNAGSVTVRATEVQLNGRSTNGNEPSGILARAESNATGNAGNVDIDTVRLTVSNGARVAAASLGEGLAGNVTIRATDTVEVTGVGRNADGKSNPTQISVLTTGMGKAGVLRIETGRLIAQDGGQVSASTKNGNGGTLTVTANNVQLIGRSPDGIFPSGLLARVEAEGKGNAGNVDIDTGRLTLKDGARVAASSLGEGKAGSVTIRATVAVEVQGVGKNADGKSNPTQISVLTTGAGKAGFLNINTGNLTVGDGGQVSASTSGSGDGGSLTVSADNVQLLSRSPDGSFPSGLLARVETGATGNGGNVTINAQRLLVQNGARVAAASLGEGKAGNVNIQATNGVEVTGVGRNADGNPNPAQVSVLSTGAGIPGNLNVNAPSVFVNDGGNLSAASKQGTGGNITLTSRNILLRRQSLISADAGAGGKDGNINITAETIVLLEGSKIITDAQSPTGGSNIAIAAPTGSDLALFVSPDSKINARGELTVEGEVELNPPEIPEVEVVDATKAIAQTCPEGEEVSTFFVTGRGGIPTSPNEPLNGDLFWEDLRVPLLSGGAGEQGSVRASERGSRGAGVQRSIPSHQSPVPSHQSPVPSPQSPVPSPQIVEAQGWKIGSKGEVILTAEAPTLTLHNSPLMLPICRKRSTL